LSKRFLKVARIRSAAAVIVSTALTSRFSAASNRNDATSHTVVAQVHPGNADVVNVTRAATRLADPSASRDERE
jgi:hypothetical protein